MTQWYFLLLAVVVAGWLVQLYLTYKQSVAFMADVRSLRKSGTVSIGIDGKRYRGGRAYVAIAVKDGIVQDALTLSGWTTFARGRPLPDLVGWKVSQVKGDREIPGLTTQQRGAARQAVTLLKEEGSRTPTNTPT